MTMEIIRKYFSNLTDEQQYQFEQLAPLYEEWNVRISIIFMNIMCSIRLQ